jgi:tetratricopeptide (TPR) repeat protein
MDIYSIICNFEAITMKSVSFIIILISLSWHTAYAQLRPAAAASQTRAVVIGVAEYQDSRIPALQYSNEDATLFANWLKSEAGGKVAPENIKLLTNAQATNGQMASAFTWLVNESKEGDLAILYFSGHGDTENQTMNNHGYLLAYDAPASNYMAGGFSIYLLQSIIQSLSTYKKAQVIMIADACRSGQLAGAEYAGTQATAKVLSDQFANEAKILSCQPNEYSLEGPQWGGGHGVFTYYLVGGLTGLADRNEDMQVSLLELQRYLEDEVTEATAPKTQIPIVLGNKGMTVSRVNSEALEAIKKERSTIYANGHNGVVKDKGIKRPATVDSDSIVKVLYQQFGQAIEQKKLLQPSGASAYDIYLRIKDHELMAPHRVNMQLDLAAAFQDEAQTALNDYLAANPAELQRRWSYDDRYKLYPIYLEKAGEILGSENFMYKDLMTREAYFRGLNLRLDGENFKDSSFYAQAREWQEKVIQLDSTASYAYNELGLLSRRAGRFEESIRYFKRALDFAPTWVLAHTNLCGSLKETGEVNEALNHCKKALARDSSFALAHYNIGLVYEEQAEMAKSIYHFNECLKYDPDYSAALNGLDRLGLLLYKLNRKDEAIEAFQAIGMLSRLSYQLDKLNRKDEAIEVLQVLYTEEPTNLNAIFNLGFIYIELNDDEKARFFFEKYVTLEPNDKDGWFGLYIAEVRLGNHELGLQYLERALQTGLDKKDIPQQIEGLDEVRSMPAYQALMDKYFTD